MTDPKEMVRIGYDKVSHAYHAAFEMNDHTYEEWIGELSALAPGGGRALDLGCGVGVPVAKLLAERFTVTGIDISPVQIESARQAVPEADFICGDMCSMEFAEGSFDLITSFYAIIHVPLDEQPSLLRNVWRWLRSGGYAMLSTGNRAWTGTEDDWLGVEGATLYWSHEGKEYYQNIFDSLGFETIWERFVPEGDGGHALFLLRKPQ